MNNVTKDKADAKSRQNADPVYLLRRCSSKVAL